jgi:hypothetical protein
MSALPLLLDVLIRRGCPAIARRWRWGLLVSLLLLASLPVATSHAQDPATLALLETVTGEVTDAAPTQRWTIEAIAGQTISARLQPSAGDLSFTLELHDTAGTVLAVGRDGGFRTLAMEAYPVAVTGQYALVVGRALVNEAAEGAGQAKGQYRLTLLPGYSYLLINDPITPATTLRSWRDLNASSRVVEGKLRLGAEGDNLLVWTTADALGNHADVYLQTSFAFESVNEYWEVGLLVRGQRASTSDEFYAFVLNSNGNWRGLLRQNNALQVLREWTAAPVTVGATGTLAVLASGDTFTLFYNGTQIGTLEDDRLPQAGVVGVALGTGVPPNQRAVALFDDLLVTVPSADHAAAAPPPALAGWEGGPEPVLAELVAANVIPVPGTESINLNSAFVSNSTPNSLIFVTLMNGLDFTDVVYAADMLWDSDVEEMACALEFRVAGGANFTIVYMDRKGGFGVRQVVNGEALLSTYALSAAVKRENRATNRLLVVAIGNGLLVYINGQLAGEFTITQETGAALVAAFNYQKANSYCGFSNIWLRSFN